MGENLSKIIEFDLDISPRETISEAKEELLNNIRKALMEKGQTNLLNNGEITIEPENTMPPEISTINIIITAVGFAANEILKEVIIPLLRKKYGIEPKSKKNNTKQKNK
jgi:hypothetical protein